MEPGSNRERKGRTGSRGQRREQGSRRWALIRGGRKRSQQQRGDPEAAPWSAAGPPLLFLEGVCLSTLQRRACSLFCWPRLALFPPPHPAAAVCGGGWGNKPGALPGNARVIALCHGLPTDQASPWPLPDSYQIRGVTEWKPWLTPRTVF